jgi:hypothetical protein
MRRCGGAKKPDREDRGKGPVGPIRGIVPEGVKCQHGQPTLTLNLVHLNFLPHPSRKGRATAPNTGGERWTN